MESGNEQWHSGTGIYGGKSRKERLAATGVWCQNERLLSGVKLLGYCEKVYRSIRKVEAIGSLSQVLELSELHKSKRSTHSLIGIINVSGHGVRTAAGVRKRVHR